MGGGDVEVVRGVKEENGGWCANGEGLSRHARIVKTGELGRVSETYERRGRRRRVNAPRR